ncbi:MAG: hypothetical protein ACI9IL_000592 [Rickettsiales bacterium]|jgi:hypothetical protein
MMEEDFYYSKDNATRFIKVVARKAINFTLITISVASFLYVTVNAYDFDEQQKEKSIKIIKSPEGVIKVRGKKDVKRVDHLDKMIYKNIVGNGKEDIISKDVKIIKNINSPSYSDIKRVEKSTVVSRIKKQAKIVDLGSDKDSLEYGSTRVQVAAMGSKDSAERYWRYISNRNPDLVENYNRYITKIDLGQRGVFYRLQIGNFKTQDKAENFCQEFILKNNKDESDCIILD